LGRDEGCPAYSATARTDNASPEGQLKMPVICSECNKSFKNERGLTVHRVRIHQNRAKGHTHALTKVKRVVTLDEAIEALKLKRDSLSDVIQDLENMRKI
jgi:hypothetical protein